MFRNRWDEKDTQTQHKLKTYTQSIFITYSCTNVLENQVKPHAVSQTLISKLPDPPLSKSMEQYLSISATDWSLAFIHFWKTKRLRMFMFNTRSSKYAASWMRHQCKEKRNHCCEWVDGLMFLLVRVLMHAVAPVQVPATLLKHFASTIYFQ